MKNKIEVINNAEIFSKFLEKYKGFRELPEQYKTDRFIKLYSRMYEYMINIPKEKIVIVNIVKRNEYVGYLFKYISKFIKAKDFYHWKDRIYSLITGKIIYNSKKSYELLYGSNWKKFYSIMKEKQKSTNIKNLGVEHPAQSKKVQEKMKATCLEIYEVENVFQSKEIQEQIKSTNLERYGEEYYTQTKEMKEKSKATCLEKYGKEHYQQIKEFLEKTKATNLAKYGREHVGGWFDVSSHSNFGNEVCTAIDNLLGNPEDSIYYAKSGKEYCIKDNDRSYYVDMVIPFLKLAFEADGVYYHGLIEGQEYVFNIPVEEIHKRDREKTIAIEKAGYKLFRIREDEYYKDPKGTIDNLLEQIKEYTDI